MSATLGPFCQSAGITDDAIKSQTLPVVEVTNGLALELKTYGDDNSYTSLQFVLLLGEINASFINANATAVVNKLNYVKEQKKKLQHKKKVKGIKNVTELLNKQFQSPVAKVTLDQNQSSVIQNASETSCESVPEPKPKHLSKCVQTETLTETGQSVDAKDLNLLQYKRRISEQKLNKVKEELSDCQENLGRVKGHYSKKNVNKRDETARKNLRRLRELQRTVMKQDRVLVKKAAGELSIVTLKSEIETLKTDNSALKDTVGSLSEDIEKEKSKKVTLQKSNSYLKVEIANLRSNAQSKDSPKNECDCAENAIKMKSELSEKDQMLCELEEQLNVVKADVIKTKNEKGIYKENIRLCIIELAGLEVAVEKMSPVIKTVTEHIVGKEITDLPNATTSQKIVDEGHYICKTFIAHKLETSQNWGLGRDGTTRRKQKILDTSVTLDSGDVMSLGFTRVARETAETIQSVTEKHMTQLSSLKSQDYLVDTLCKLSFTMSDRASNEKKADRLLDEWRTDMLAEYPGDKEEVHHFHCMAHVLLGLHNYSTPALKDFEQTLKNETGPLGSENNSFFHPWKSESVANRTVRTVSDTFGPAGSHLGVRDRWEAFCSQNGIKSIIGNYRDNRFNAFFQTSAEVFLHRKDFIKVLDTISNPNGKLRAVKSDLESNDVVAILQCLGLFYLKVTGPYWNLVTCGKVPYLQLHTHVQDIKHFLEAVVEEPAHLLRKDQHWTATDPLGISTVPSSKVLSQALFKLHEEFRDVLLRVIPVVATAMLQCVKKQLADFLADGKYHTGATSDPRTDFAPVTNLSCEHHFGDLDSSQKRRPHASFHHHTSVQMLKRNRKPLMQWLGTMGENEKSSIMTDARKGGKLMRNEHREQEQEVLATIHENMIMEKAKVSKRKLTSEKTNKNAKRKRSDSPVCSENIAPVVDLGENNYVAVAYQDDWYPGCVQKVIDENTVEIKYMAHCRKPGHFQWPSREDKQIVVRHFVLYSGFVPDCVSSGRQWYIKEHDKISEAYSKYHAMYFQ